MCCSDLQATCQQLKQAWRRDARVRKPRLLTSALPTQSSRGLFNDRASGSLPKLNVLHSDSRTGSVRSLSSVGRGPVPGENCGFHSDFWEERGMV